jgi:hypothetical protein
LVAELSARVEGEIVGAKSAVEATEAMPRRFNAIFVSSPQRCSPI